MRNNIKAGILLHVALLAPLAFGGGAETQHVPLGLLKLLLLLPFLLLQLLDVLLEWMPAVL
jgi:hypothetical protein